MLALGKNPRFRQIVAALNLSAEAPYLSRDQAKAVLPYLGKISLAKQAHVPELEAALVRVMTHKKLVPAAIPRDTAAAMHRYLGEKLAKAGVPAGAAAAMRIWQRDLVDNIIAPADRAVRYEAAHAAGHIVDSMANAEARRAAGATAGLAAATHRGHRAATRHFAHQKVEAEFKAADLHALGQTLRDEASRRKH